MMLNKESFELLNLLEHLICKVNAVTVFHRHHNSVPKIKLDELSECQIEVEHKLKELDDKFK